MAPSRPRVPVATSRPRGFGHVRFDSATALGGWALTYTALAIIWWPTLLAGLAIGLIARHRCRIYAAALADLTEAIVDLYGNELTKVLNHPYDLDPSLSPKITEAFRKGRGR